MYKVIPLLLILTSTVCAYELKPHEHTWQKWSGTFYFHPDLQAWFEQTNDRTLIRTVNHLKAVNYKSILDIGCGVGTLYNALKKNNLSLDYCGVEITPKLVSFMEEKNIPLIAASAEEIPVQNKSFDCVVIRHLLEHLPSYEKALKEAARIAKKEIHITFFIPPTRMKDSISLLKFPDGAQFYNNHYNKAQLERFIRSLKEVQSIVWELETIEESILHIYLQ